MIKKIAFIGALCFSINTFADVVSSTYVDQTSYLTTNVLSSVYTKHNYIIDNQSGVDQTVQVCFDITMCPEYPQNTKNFNECISETVPNGQMINREKIMKNDVLYHFSGYCDIVARTTMNGWTSHSSSAQGKIKVWPNK